MSEVGQPDIVTVAATAGDFTTLVAAVKAAGGEVLAADVIELSSANTVEGQAIRITADAAGVQVNDANVIATDVMASNGVIHVIDSVLIPSCQNTTNEAPERLHQRRKLVAAGGDRSARHD